MNTHEFQAKTLLLHYGVPIPSYRIADSINSLDQIIKEWEYPGAVLKVQIHAGGRGKAGGVKLAHSKEEMSRRGRELLGKRIVNNQTGSEGVIASQIMVTPLLDYVQEYYLGVIIDRQSAQVTIIASPSGGMDIEEIARSNPEKILTLHVGASGKLRGYQLIRLNKFMGWEGKTAQQGQDIAQALVKVFLENDGSLLEINPLVRTSENDLLALDAKFSIDDNALFRHADISAFYDPSQIPLAEAEAHKNDLAYIALNGNIGCMVNGAGLAMATMDIIQHYGGRPANFLDVGGGASTEKVAAGFKILINDPNVKVILVNIFGGIMNCETLAEGIISAIQEISLNKPLIVRMEGTNADKGRSILSKSGLSLNVADNLTEAAQKAVAAANS